MRQATPSARTRFAKGAALLALVAGLTGLSATSAAALPPDGPGPESPGTSSRVWPTTVAPGDVLYFEVSGYPANETVYIKIDDGTMCSDTSHGACVYHTQALDGNGYASGSLVLPADLAPGPHWLRMLATGDVFDPVTGEKLGYEGYTRRGGNDFTVVANGGGGGTGSGSANQQGGGATRSDGTLEGGSVSLDVGDEDPTAEPGSGTGSTASDPANSAESQGSTAEASAQQNGDASEFPVLGTSVLAGSVVLGGGALVWALLRGRNRSSGTSTPE